MKFWHLRDLQGPYVISERSKEHYMKLLNIHELKLLTKSMKLLLKFIKKKVKRTSSMISKVNSYPFWGFVWNTFINHLILSIALGCLSDKQIDPETEPHQNQEEVHSDNSIQNFCNFAYFCGSNLLYWYSSLLEP